MKLKEILQNYKAPVSDAEWQSIIQDPAVTRFNRSKRLTRAAIYGAGATLLVAVAVLVGVGLSQPKNNQPTAENTNAKEVVTTPMETPTVETTTPNSTTAPTAVEESFQTVESTVEKNNMAAQETQPLAQTVTPKQSVNTITEALAQPKKSATVAQTSTPDKLATASTAATKSAKPTKTTTPVKEEIANEETPTELPEESAFVENFFVPNSFTPNADGINDVFMAKANFEPELFEMSIYARSGEMVFKCRNMNIGWDGGSHPGGIYNYVIKYTNAQGKVLMKKGQVMMLK